MNEQSKPKSIVYFDTNCRLCNGYVDFTGKRDTKTTTDAVSIYSLASESNESLPDSIIFEQDGVRYYRSTAVLKHWIEIGGFLRVLGYLGFIVPRVIRDWIYDFVAKRRYQWFGTMDTEKESS